MAIVKRPSAPAPSTAVEEAVVDRFIQSAPDGTQVHAAEPDDDRGVQITLRIHKAQLDRVTAAAKRQGIPRASYIKRAIAMQLESDNKK